MERWELKMICAAVALAVSVACSFLPFLLIHVDCKKIREKFVEKRMRKERGASKRKSAAATPSGNAGPRFDPELRPSPKSPEKDANDNLPGEITRESEGEAETETGTRGDDNDVDDHPKDGEESTPRGQDRNFLSILMCFGGGVFFGTFLLHMLPEVTELLALSLIKPRHIRYPVTELLIAAGFFMILFVEELVNACQRLKRKARGSSDGRKSSVREAIRAENQNDDSSATFRKSSEDVGLEEVSIDPGNDGKSHGSEGDAGGHADDHPHDGHDHHQHHQDDEHQHSHSHHNTRSIVLVLALSLHHIFEGLSIGLQKHFSNVWHLTVAVLCHETAICFSMGLQFYKSDQRLGKAVAFILFLASSVMPLGIVIGIAISESHQDSTEADEQDWQNVLNGVLQALACGTFIYVTFFEILCEELSHGRSAPLKVVFVGLGFAFMALLGLIPEGAEETPMGGVVPSNTTAGLDSTPVGTTMTTTNGT